MKLRLLSVLALLSTMLLAACDSSTPAAPTPIAGNGPNVDAQEQTTPTSPGVNAEADGPLTLVPVTVQTNEATAIGNLTTTRTLNLPEGFHVTAFAAGLQHVRKMAFAPDGTLYATVRGEGRVVRLPDKDNDGFADQVQTVQDGITGVHGIAFNDGKLYVANETDIMRLDDADGDGVADGRQVLVNDLPTGGTGRAGANHTTRTIIFGPDNKLYVSIGSSCNACLEEDERRAAVSRYSLDGTFEKVFAGGIRNAVGIGFHPITGELWAVNNGRDGLGDELPPEAVYKLREDGNYGWPYCYGDRVTDTTLDFPVPEGYCEKVDTLNFSIEPHSAPLGMAFYYGEQWPAKFKGDMFIGIHGSWDRTSPRGYKIVRARFKDNQPDMTTGSVVVEDFANGWLLPDKTHWGRPVDLLVAPDGSLFVTDDAGMAIYKIWYDGKSEPQESSVVIPGMPACVIPTGSESSAVSP